MKELEMIEENNSKITLERYNEKIKLSNNISEKILYASIYEIKSII